MFFEVGVFSFVLLVVCILALFVLWCEWVWVWGVFVWLFVGLVCWCVVVFCLCLGVLLDRCLVFGGFVYCVWVVDWLCGFGVVALF